ncbi:MAG TPA: tripartite tricarboxylate transporter substrate-binding protein [Alphaproteobacteria bacterium]|jgi:tripartite-type tricarboxylate transporter receptor subunit TctC|nr:tripartite tricarboxylate transporter substrate-binding protein [Alphaproteobacteria bacterium]
MSAFRCGAIAASLAILACAPAWAQAEFYKDKSLKLIVGTDAGGSYDFSGRLVARHIGRAIAGNPQVIVQNMPGAASLNAANFVYNVAPQDGTVIAAFVQTLPQTQLFGDKNVKFDAAKFNWIGNPSSSVTVVVAWHTAPVKRIEDALDHSIVMGAAGQVGLDFTMPSLLNNELGTKFQVVPGYKGGNEIDLAMERGEVMGRAGQSWDGWKVTRPDWVRDRKIVPLVQIGLEKAKDLSNVPLALDLARTDEQKRIIELFSSAVAIGRPIVTGPRVPEERVKMLRDAFRATMVDPQFREEAAKTGYEIDPVYGEDLQKLIVRLMAAPPDIAAKAQRAIAAR